MYWVYNVYFHIEYIDIYIVRLYNIIKRLYLLHTYNAEFLLLFLILIDI